MGITTLDLMLEALVPESEDDRIRRCGQGDALPRRPQRAEMDRLLSASRQVKIVVKDGSSGGDDLSRSR